VQKNWGFRFKILASAIFFGKKNRNKQVPNYCLLPIAYSLFPAPTKRLFAASPNYERQQKEMAQAQAEKLATNIKSG